MILATDLDNTMIFSHRHVSGKENQLCCVEYYNGKPVTYMTQTAIEMLNLLLSKIFVIPVTTRSMSQFERIEIFSSTEYSIVDNGGTILHSGTVQPDWENYINKILKKYDLERTLEIFKNLPGLISTPRIVDQKFLFAKSDDVALCKAYLKCKLDTKIWQVSFQGKKVYAIPMEITKGNALRFICENLIPNNQPIVSAGDSNLDMSMLDYSNYSIIPSDSSLSALNIDGYIKTGEGIYAADEILKFVNDIFNKI